MAGTRKLERFDGADRADAALPAAHSFKTPAQPIEVPALAKRSLPPADPNALKTRMARRFSTLADEVSECFVDFRVGAGAWTVELTAPEEMSTGGGKRALQRLRLRPTREGYPVLVGGFVNPVARTATLRDHAQMSALHTRRFGCDLQISGAEWEQVLRKAEVVLKLAHIAAVREPPSLELVLAARAGRRIGGQRALALLALAVLVPLASFVAFRIVANFTP
jgi:hypothetical protein